MPWTWVPSRGRRNASRRRGRRTFRNGDDWAAGPNGSANGSASYAADFDPDSYGDGDDQDNYRPARRGRQRADNGDDFDGLYDRDGRTVSLVIQTPRDLLPPQRRALEREDNWDVLRSSARARF